MSNRNLNETEVVYVVPEDTAERKPRAKTETWVLANVSLVVFGLLIAGLISFDLYRRLKPPKEGYTAPASRLNQYTGEAARQTPAPAQTSGNSASPMPLLAGLPIDMRDDIPASAQGSAPGAGPSTAKINSTVKSFSAIFSKYKTRPGVSGMLSELKSAGLDLTGPEVDNKALITAYANPKYQAIMMKHMAKPEFAAAVNEMIKDPEFMAALMQAKDLASGAANQVMARNAAAANAGGQSGSR